MNRHTLKAVRENAGYTHERMGQVLGYSKGHYRNIECGHTPIPKSLNGAYLLLKLSKHYKDLTKSAELLVGW